ncbi:hypothetical protein GCM10011378_39500 [Hymenobacter glacieicola]|uniref:Uncharacterized protein n=1 Tax=Hymenobacter glacieicola TaxID=1562124 RepID=A0ABQ1X6B4_9BACT|nr:hypothetical protein GCM10011378_39500 [Hymenobacter glacieicola]
MDQATYKMYLQEPSNGLSHTREISSVTVCCTYQPTDLLVAQELVATSNISSKVIDSVRRNYAGKTYLVLSLAQNKAEIENQYITDQPLFTRALTYLNSGIAQDVYVVTVKPQHDSVAALAALYPRQYGTTGRSTVLLVFDTHQLDLTHGFTLAYHDTQFQLGSLRFPFREEALTNLPKLKF